MASVTTGSLCSGERCGPRRPGRSVAGCRRDSGTPWWKQPSRPGGQGRRYLHGVGEAVGPGSTSAGPWRPCRIHRVSRSPYLDAKGHPRRSVGAPLSVPPAGSEPATPGLGERLGDLEAELRLRQPRKGVGKTQPTMAGSPTGRARVPRCTPTSLHHAAGAVDQSGPRRPARAAVSEPSAWEAWATCGRFPG